MDTNILTQTLDTLKSSVTGSITGKVCDESKSGAVAHYKTNGKDESKPVLNSDGSQQYVEFPPFTFSLEIDWTGYGDVGKWLSQFVNPQAAIRWANKVRPHGLDYVKANQKIVAVDFFVKQLGFGGDPATRALSATDKIDDVEDIQKLIERAQARKKQLAK